MRFAAIFAALLATWDALPAGAQQSADTLTIAPDRNGTAATVFGVLLPGAGHIYASEYLRGAGFYFETVSSIGAGVMIHDLDRCTFAFLSATPCEPGRTWPQRTLGVALVATGVATWAISAVDAHRAVDRRLARRRAALLRQHVSAVDWGPFLDTANSAHRRLLIGIHGIW